MFERPRRILAIHGQIECVAVFARGHFGLVRAGEFALAEAQNARLALRTGTVEPDLGSAAGLASDPKRALQIEVGRTGGTGGVALGIHLCRTGLSGLSFMARQDMEGHREVRDLAPARLVSHVVDNNAVLPGDGQCSFKLVAGVRANEQGGICAGRSDIEIGRTLGLERNGPAPARGRTQQVLYAVVTFDGPLERDRRLASREHHRHFVVCREG